MPKHLGLALEAFVNAVSPDLMDRYRQRLGPNGPGAWDVFNGQAMATYLGQAENAEIAALIREDLQRVNDVSQYGIGTLLRACGKHGVEFVPNATPETLAMSLFIDHPDAFDFAWSRFLLYGAPGIRLSVHPMPLGHLRLGADQLLLFRADVQQWFARQAKGEQCIVEDFQDSGETVILIKHGVHVRTLPFWDGPKISVTSLRPAIEDVLVYEPDTSLLRIRASLPKDRREYLRLFAAHIAGDEALADKEELFSLEPVQNQTFDYGGTGPIAGIELRKVRMQLHGATKVVADFRSRDILNSFKYDLPGLGLASGIVTLARFCFHIHFPGEKRTSVTFSIEPPATTDLAERRYSDLIMNYLERQGVKLR